LETITSTIYSFFTPMTLVGDFCQNSANSKLVDVDRERNTFYTCNYYCQTCCITLL